MACGIRGRLIDGDVDRGRSRGERLVKKHAAINRANQHGPAADRRIIEVIAAFGVGFRARHGLHASLELDQQDIHAGGGFIAVRAVVNDA